MDPFHSDTSFTCRLPSFLPLPSLAQSRSSDFGTLPAAPLGRLAAPGKPFPSRAQRAIILVWPREKHTDGGPSLARPLLAGAPRSSSCDHLRAGLVRRSAWRASWLALAHREDKRERLSWHRTAADRTRLANCLHPPPPAEKLVLNFSPLPGWERLSSCFAWRKAWAATQTTGVREEERHSAHAPACSFLKLLMASYYFQGTLALVVDTGFLMWSNPGTKIRSVTKLCWPLAAVCLFILACTMPRALYK